MTKLPYKKRDAAIQQLETAIRLYHESNDPFSVITLAGAAEEILGQLVKASGNTNSLEVLNSTALAIQRLEGEEKPRDVIDRANYARNNLKHLALPDDNFSIDAWEEATDMLTRATDNYWLLDDCPSPTIENFLQQVRTPRS